MNDATQTHAAQTITLTPEAAMDFLRKAGIEIPAAVMPLPAPIDPAQLQALTTAVSAQLAALKAPSVYETYIRPALPYAACVVAGAGMGVLGAYYFLGEDDEELAS